MPLEADTRVADHQARLRRINSKMRDAGVEQLIWLVADTRANRAAMDAAGAILRDQFPVGTRAAFNALAAGRRPVGSALILL